MDGGILSGCRWLVPLGGGVSRYGMGMYLQCHLEMDRECDLWDGRWTTENMLVLHNVKCRN